MEENNSPFTPSNIIIGILTIIGFAGGGYALYLGWINKGDGIWEVLFTSIEFGISVLTATVTLITSFVLYRRSKNRPQPSQAPRDTIKAQGDVIINNFETLGQQYIKTQAPISEEDPPAPRPVDNQNAKSAYLEKMADLYGYIQVLSQPTPKPLEEVFTDVYLHEKPTHTYTEGIENLRESYIETGRFRPSRKDRKNGLELAKTTQRLFVLGKPGAGKSTFLRYLTMQAIERKIAGIPIFVSLNDLSNRQQSILDFMVDRFDVCDFPNARPFIEQNLKDGTALVLFDGLDEVSREKDERNRLTRDLKRFIDKYSRSKYVITCRIAASDYKFERFDYVEMADFTPEQVERFVRSWFTDSERKRDGFLADLKKRENKGIQEMTTSPLLLTMLCIQYNSTMGFLPSRSEVYEKAITVLLTDWDSSRNISRNETIVENDEGRYKALSPARKNQLMSVLAHETFVNNELFIPQSWLEDKIAVSLSQMPGMPTAISGPLILKAMESQHGLLVERASRIYSFSHLTFQEYFTARYIVDNALAGTLTDLTKLERIIDPRWREVFLFVAEMLPDAAYFVLPFAESLKTMAGKNTDLRQLVEWCAKRSHAREFGQRQMPSRVGYLASALDRAINRAINRARDRAFASASDLASTLDLDRALARASDRARALKLARDLASALAFARARALNLDLAFDRTRALDLDLDRALDRALDLALDRALDLALDRALDLASALNLDPASALDLDPAIFIIEDIETFFVLAIEKIVEECQILEWPQLVAAYQAVIDSLKANENKINDAIVKQLRKIEAEIILDNWKWEAVKARDLEAANAWLKGHELLFKCLDRATLKTLNRQTFEDEHLYMPPLSYG